MPTITANQQTFSRIVDFVNRFGATRRDGRPYAVNAFRRGELPLSDGRTVLFLHFDRHGTEVGEWTNRLENNGTLITEYARVGGLGPIENIWRNRKRDLDADSPPRVLILGKMGDYNWRFLGEFELCQSQLVGTPACPAWEKWRRVADTVRTLR